MDLPPQKIIMVKLSSRDFKKWTVKIVNIKKRKHEGEIQSMNTRKSCVGGERNHL